MPAELAWTLMCRILQALRESFSTISLKLCTTCTVWLCFGRSGAILGPSAERFNAAGYSGEMPAELFEKLVIWRRHALRGICTPFRDMKSQFAMAAMSLVRDGASGRKVHFRPIMVLRWLCQRQPSRAGHKRRRGNRAPFTSRGCPPMALEPWENAAFERGALANLHPGPYDTPMHVLSIPYRDPAAAFSVFAADEHAALLDRDRLSVIAAEPLEVVTATEAGGFIDGVYHASDPFETLGEVWQRRRRPNRRRFPFCGALIGYLGYELGDFLEKLPPPKAGSPPIPAMSFGVYDTAALFDHRRRRAFVAGAGKAKAADFAARLAAAPVELPPAAMPAVDMAFRAEPRRGGKHHPPHHRIYRRGRRLSGELHAALHGPKTAGAQRFPAIPAPEVHQPRALFVILALRRRVDCRRIAGAVSRAGRRRAGHGRTDQGNPASRQRSRPRCGIGQGFAAKPEGQRRKSDDCRLDAQRSVPRLRGGQRGGAPSLRAAKLFPCPSPGIDGDGTFAPRP